MAHVVNSVGKSPECFPLLMIDTNWEGRFVEQEQRVAKKAIIYSVSYKGSSLEAKLE